MSKITEQNFLRGLFNKRLQQYGVYTFTMHKQVLSCGTNFLRELNIADIDNLLELIFAIVKDQFFELGIIFCDFQRDAFI